MDKSGGSSRLISTLMRPTTGGDSDVYLDKSSKKEKLSCMGLLGEMDQLSHSINTNSTTTTNRVKLPKKFPDHCGAINHASAPRKLRSAMKKRDTKKHKAVAVGNRSEAQKPRLGFEEELKNSKMSSVMTRDEEEVAETLFALAQAGLNTTPQLVEVKPTPSSIIVKETLPPNTRNRCSVHVYIFIKLLQTKIDNGSNQGRPNTNPQTITTNDNYADIVNTPKTTTETTTSQDFMGLHPTNPNIEQTRQCISKSLLACDKGKMQLSDRSSGYDEKGGLFFVDGLTLNLTL